MNDSTQTDVVVVGRIGGAFGVRGWVRIVSYTDPVENLLDYTPWMLNNGRDQWRSVDVREVRPHGKGFVAALKDVVGRDQAQALTGKIIGIPAAALPAADAGEYYWRDLVGMRATNLQDQDLGVVDHLIETPAHDVLVIKRQGAEVLVPYVPQVVRSVDLDRKMLILDWIE